MLNDSCATCGKLFIQSEEIYETKCVHMFHYDCLSFWLQSSETCPECEKIVTHADIHKVHFNSSRKKETSLSNTGEQLEELPKTQNEIVKVVSDQRIEKQGSRSLSRTTESQVTGCRTEEYTSDGFGQRRGNINIYNKNGTVIICNQYQPAAMNVYQSSSASAILTEEITPTMFQSVRLFFSNLFSNLFSKFMK